jgi:NDP-sugar pyrophosphorylase family protein
VVCVGYLGEQIERRIGAEQFGMSIAYSHDGPNLAGTLGAIRRAVPLLGDRFLVLYGDTYLRIDYRAVVAAWKASGLPAVMTLLRNEGEWDTSNAVFRDATLERYDKHQPTPDMRWIDYGLGGLTVQALDRIAPGEQDLALLYKELARRRELAGYEATERFYEIGTRESLREADRFLRSLAPGGRAVGIGQKRQVSGSAKCR